MKTTHDIFSSTFCASSEYIKKNRKDYSFNYFNRLITREHEKKS